ncbi:MAG TPA: glycosyltransferase [Gemmatimonadaceae bacterium]|nr:glycosyltransferase [Gemmatimonadaceae bacterium]
MAPPKTAIGYVVRKFPVLSETFILNEILALEAMGVTVEIFSLAPTRDPRFHDGLCRLKANVHYLPTPAEPRALLRIAKRFAARNPKRYRRQLIKVIATRRPKLLWRFVQASWVADRARRTGVRHLHAHFANRSATVAQQAAKLLGVPFSFTAHAFDIYRGADHAVIARKMADSKFTVTVSEFNVRFLDSLMNGKRGRVELVRNGIDMSRFMPAPRVPMTPFRILTVARLVEKKGIPVLVEACRVLRDRGHKFRCDIIGKGALRAELERNIRANELGSMVRLLGPLPQQEIIRRYQVAHVVALPCIVAADGNRDGLPVSIVEAMACGLPVISTPVTGIPEVIQDGCNGLLVPEGDAVALADALERMMTDDELYARLRSSARASVCESFDQRRTAAKLYDLLHEETA